MRYVVACLLSAGLTMNGVAFAQGGARALFATGEGTAISAPSVPKQAAPAKRKESFSGISYKILEVGDNGTEVSVSSKKIFRSGDRIRIVATVNKPGYLRVINLGPTGNVNKLFEGHVNSAQRVDIPQRGVIRFAGPAGMERVLILLSNVPFESDNTAGFSACGTVKVARSRDLVIDDSMDSEFSVVSKSQGCAPVTGATRDLVIESVEGSNYGVVPSLSLTNDAALALEIKLQHL